MAAEWHYTRDGERAGPVTAAQLKQLVRSGKLTRNDMVWKEGMAKWTPAGQVRGLFDVAPPQNEKTVPPPLPVEQDDRTDPEEASLLTHPVVRKILSDKLLLLGCCLGVAVVLTVLVPTLLVPNRLSTFPPDILAEPGFENVKKWDDPRLEAEIDRRERENTRTASSRATSGMATGVLVLTDITLVTLIGFVAYRRYFASATNKMYDRGGPELPQNYPWSVEERSASNPKLMWLKIGIGASIVVGVLCLASIVGAIFCLPFFSAAFLIYFLAFRTGRLHGRWVPVEGQAGWVEFLPGGIFKREDGTVGTFAVLPNQKFIDILASGHLVDSWRVLAWGVDMLEVQDMAGVVRNFKKGKTLAEKQASVFSTDRNYLLQRKWEPVNGDGPAIQFTEDGAMIRFDGFAARYTLTGEEPNEVIVIHIDDKEQVRLKVLSLSRDEMVVTGEGGTCHYRRGVSITDAESQRRAEAAKEKLKAVGKAALITVGAIGAGIAVLGVAAAAAGQTTCIRCGFTRVGLHSNCPNCGW